MPMVGVRPHRRAGCECGQELHQGPGRRGPAEMTERLRLGLVAGGRPPAGAWERLRHHLRDEAHLAIELAVFQDYESQTEELLTGRLDIAWNSSLAHLRCEAASRGACRALAQRDTDLGRTTVILVLKGGPVRALPDLKGRTLALGSRDSAQAALLPVHFLAVQGIAEGTHYDSLRLDADLGKHGDTGRSETDVLKALLGGRADAGAVGSAFWAAATAERLVPNGALAETWRSPPCAGAVFDTRPGLGLGTGDAFVQALQRMRWKDPGHRAILEAMGLTRWVVPEAKAYDPLRAALAAADPPGARRWEAASP